MTTEDQGPSGRTLRRIGTGLGLAVVLLSGIAVLGMLAGPGPLAPDAPSRTLSADRAEAVTRQVTAAFENIQAVWKREFARRFGRDYVPPEVRFYTGTTVSPCSDGQEATGPFYCPRSVEAVFDLAFFEALNARLRRSGDLGAALVVAMISASYVQDELGLLAEAETRRREAGGRDATAVDEALAAQADCLAGVWAALAADSVGVVPPGFYDQLIGIARNVMADRAGFAPEMPSRLDPFEAASRATREADFAAGYGAADPAACLPGHLVSAEG
ncbi:MAG TPA: neutral zinc metallopeptidase [Amaricoccus sp.]|uniref:neutral zinc metallopeptidase n=1 Tax=Amaricoccus sp. TaxID=1872485 RepID=UPI001D202A0B|nr:neutral zinc metallopeptidase [Amaricoccus sp.]MCB1375750.1 neutral zinc metallopeptidase [Paracoccaceae bacterium]MCC0066209.1 neutral zinc metallopeptidase [Rhodovulum sp.]MCB1403549.1 neutral zinc metallopeptidase [Paracoccaceae bacterium]HPG22565.1 neutral zinc metallopeptidase [Amaricoccus sp.]HRW15822.1 neutral zinc metallopeptidase [Amaricoccus sp.]